MRYSLGCAFTLEELVSNFPYKKLEINCSKCKEVIGNEHRNILVKKIFRESVKLVVHDIISNNITFWLPLTGSKKCNIHMRRVSGEEFKNLRKSGKWNSIDIVTSMFSGYEISLFMLGKRTPRVKTVYVGRKLRDKISENTNKGMLYGDSKFDKWIKDYYLLMYEKFPTVPKRDIERILNFSWKSLYLHNSYGGDTLISDKDFWCYIGNLKKDSLDHFYYYIRKLTIKLRVLYKRKKILWNGYYYFALSEKLYQKYLSLKNKKGRPRKYFNFGTVYLYEILDECRINEHSKLYIFQIPFITKLKMRLFVRELTSKEASLILVRRPLKFKDILVYDNEYEFL